MNQAAHPPGHRGEVSTALRASAEVQAAHGGEHLSPHGFGSHQSWVWVVAMRAGSHGVTSIRLSESADGDFSAPEKDKLREVHVQREGKRCASTCLDAVASPRCRELVTVFKKSGELVRRFPPGHAVLRSSLKSELRIAGRFHNSRKSWTLK